MPTIGSRDDEAPATTQRWVRQSSMTKFGDKEPIQFWVLIGLIYGTDQFGAEHRWHNSTMQGEEYGGDDQGFRFE